jgi:hypothetical protein
VVGRKWVGVNVEAEGVQNWSLKNTRGREHWKQLPGASTSSILFFDFDIFPIFSVPVFSVSSNADTAPLRHAPRCSRNFPSNTSSQAGDDVQCDIGEGYSGNVQKVYGKR